MGIMTRVIRIFKADVHGVMDQLEDQELLLKQHLRDMAEDLNLKEARLNKMHLARQQMQHELDQYHRRAETLERDLAVAIHKNKDDIARMLIRKIKPLENLRDEIAVHIRNLDKDISHHQDLLDRQRLQHEQLKHRSITFFQKTPVKEMPHDPGDEMPDGMRGELTEEEIELELLKRKEAQPGYAGNED